MIFKRDMSLIVTVVDSGFSTKVIDASKLAGADGATVLQGRGTGIHESTTFMGVGIQPGKDIVLIIVSKSHRKNIMKEIVRACNLTTEGKGLTFCVPIDELAGANHLLKKKRNIFSNNKTSAPNVDAKQQEKASPELEISKEKTQLKEQ